MECLQADIIVAAVGRPEMVQPDWVKEGAIVVDVGINRADDSSRERGWRLAGDVHPDVALTASLLSPVPAGCWPYDCGDAHGQHRYCCRIIEFMM